MKPSDLQPDGASYERVAQRHPALAKEWDTFRNDRTAYEVSATDKDIRVWWVCDQGHRWQTNLGSRIKAGGKLTQCAQCVKFGRVAPGENDLATKSPVIAGDWHPTMNGDLRPDHVREHSGQIVWWLGVSTKCWHSWPAKINNRVTLGAGCRICGGKQVLADFNDLGSRNPSLAAEWHPLYNGHLKPTMVTASSTAEVWWKCRSSADHSWLKKINHRATSGSGCPHCRKRSGIERHLGPRLKDLFPSLQTNARLDIPWRGQRTMEVDFYDPTSSTAIEYDGSYWHSLPRVTPAGKVDPFEVDVDKTHALVTAGIRVIRIRENDLLDLTLDSPSVIQMRHLWQPKERGLDELARRIADTIHERFLRPDVGEVHDTHDD